MRTEYTFNAAGELIVSENPEVHDSLSSVNEKIESMQDGEDKDRLIALIIDNGWMLQALEDRKAIENNG